MKRSQRINPAALRKRFKPKPLTLAIAATTLAGCSSSVQTRIYESVAQCADANPGFENRCETAYQLALAKATRTGPRYAKLEDCEYDFGEANCVAYEALSGNQYVPVLAGFALRRPFDDSWDDDDWDDDNYYIGLYRSYGRGARYRNQWLTGDGAALGPTSRRMVSIDSDSFRAKTTTRTLSRGGFGRMAASRSSRSGGWGG